MLDLIKRNTPDIAKAFVLETIEKENGKSVYHLSARGNKIVLGGDCKISQAMAYYRYLKDYCGVSLSHCGNNGIPPITEAPLPTAEVHHVIEQEKRAFLSYEAFGNSCAFWDWERWEREIDFMAMNGINMPLAVVGSEAVWFYTMREFKYTEPAALNYLTGPAFWPQQLLGNITAYFPLCDKAYVDARLKLGQQIIHREVELGMTPIQPAFNGTVPRSVSRLFRTAKIRLLPAWQGFPATYVLEPTDPIFRKFGLALMEKQRQLFGAYHYYICNLFYDTKPTSKAKDFLWNCGRAFDKFIHEFDSEGVWVMRSDSLYEQMVKAVPAGSLLMLDLNGKLYKKTDGFWGHDFLLGRVYNFNDRSMLQGDIRALAANPYLEAKEACENCKGVGLFPQGVNQNPLYDELALHMMTQSAAVDLDLWLADYARRRYGSNEECLVKALALLIDTCYGENTGDTPLGSVLAARPTTELRHAAPGDSLHLPYDNAALLQAANLLLEAGNADTAGYRFDVCDITRQVLSNRINDLYGDIMNAYHAKDVNSFERSTNLFLKIAEEMDALLQSVPELTLHEQLKAASACAFTDKDKQNFELNLLTQVTLWGPVNSPVLYDYAWKEWGGLVNSYYAARWHSYFEQLAIFFKKKHFRTETRKQINERNVYGGSKFYRNYEKFEKNWLSTVSPEAPTEADTVALARELTEKYGKQIERASLQ